MAFGNLDNSPSSAKNSAPISDINVTPMVDVMLVLLIIFIITAPLMVSSIQLDLPQTDAAQQNEESNFISISLDQGQKLYLNDKPIERSALKAALEARAKQDPNTEVQLNADSAVPYGTIVDVMGLAQNAGLKRIGFIADPDAQ